MTKAIAFAPATIANIGPGFDVLGVAIHDIGDIVEAELASGFSGVRLVEIVNNPGLPLGPKNVVEAVGNKIYEAYIARGEKIDFGIKLTLVKNMRIGSGTGSSASSSVASAMATNSLLGECLGNPFKKDAKEMIEAVVHGEYVACGSRHGDNALPSLLGGLILIHDTKKFEYLRFEVPDSIYFVVVQPELRVDTRDAREKLKDVPYNLGELVKTTGMLLKCWAGGSIDDGTTQQTIEAILKENGSKEVVLEYLAGALEVMFGLIDGNALLLGGGVTKDGIITPVRAGLIKGYKRVGNAGLKAGAYGVSISGSGPTLFAVAKSQDEARAIGNAMKGTWGELNVNSRVYISPVNNDGAMSKLCP